MNKFKKSQLRLDAAIPGHPRAPDAAASLLHKMADMAMSTDVNLPKTHKARFPNRCVACLAEEPDARLRFLTGSIGWWSWLLAWFGRPFTVHVPACKSCRLTMRLQRYASFAITIALLFLAWEFVVPELSEDYTRSTRRWLMLGVGLLALTPQILYEVFFPRPFDLTAYSKSVDYEFKDEAYAHEFATLNEDAAWVKIS